MSRTAATNRQIARTVGLGESTQRSARMRAGKRKKDEENQQASARMRANSGAGHQTAGRGPNGPAKSGKLQQKQSSDGPSGPSYSGAEVAKLARRIRELQPAATNRQIARTVGLDESALRAGKTAEGRKKAKEKQRNPAGMPANYSGADVAKLADRHEKRAQSRAEAEAAREKAAEMAPDKPLASRSVWGPALRSPAAA